eukprot:10689386-Alexandrium_andersonii.AAC.1
MEPWIRSWLPDKMFGVFKNRSAIAASWLLASELEHTKLLEQYSSMLSVDIYKCFDQVSRQQIVVLSALMGAPMGVVCAWFRVMQVTQ